MSQCAFRIENKYRETMLSKIFKKSEAPLKASSTSAKAGGATRAKTEAATAEAAQVNAQLSADWQSKLQTAMGDDAALLAIAKASPVVDIKQAAVSAISGEETLKLAEREFRTHDRRVHRAAKQRYEMLVATREAREGAAKLIEAAALLIKEEKIPANRLVELDRAWLALDIALLEPAQRSEFEALAADLATLTRERGAHQLAVNRWTADTKQALGRLNVICVDVAAGLKTRTDLSRATEAAQAALTSMPAGEAAAELGEALQAALQKAAQIEARLILLEELEQPAAVAPAEAVAAIVTQPDAPDASPAGTALDESTIAEPAEDAVETVPADAVPTVLPTATSAPTPAPPPSSPKPAERWGALTAIADAQIANALNARFEQWQRSQDNAREARQAGKRQQANEKKNAVKSERSDALAAIVQQAEVALAGGHLAETNKHLVAIDSELEKGAPTGALRGRIDAVQAEYARLKGWQHWGGGRVHDDLVLEAEALAKASTSAEGEQEGKRAAKLPIKQHGEAIEQLRERWKELDKLGGATSRALWQRFDTALKTAYLPVAAHLAKLKAARQENLEARNKLIAALDAVVLADGGQGAEGDMAQAPDWKVLTHALEHFQTEWRKLGPLEHTVPHKAREKLLQRMNASVARLETPLHDARRVAQLQREKFIERAKALSAEAAAKPQNRELITKVRELQSEWQQHAKTLALARNVENALWKEFKAATDAIFTQRDAVFSARDAEFKANQVAREALIGKLAALGTDTPATEIKRTVSDVDAAWRRAGEAPRANAAKLETQFRNARDAAQKLLAGSAARSWHATIDALNAKRALCEEFEAQPTQPVADIEARWQAVATTLPPQWEQALLARLARAKNGSAPVSSEALASVLLQLESALDMASPPEFQAARRDLKLRAMKAALEGKPTSGSFSTDAEKLTADAIGFAQIDASSRDRLAAIIAHLRTNGLKGGRV